MKKLFIIDDNKAFLEELKDLLESPEIDISLFETSSTETIGMIRENKPDLILMDLKMDQLSGIQMAALIHLSREIPDIPVVFMSGYYNGEEIKSAMDILEITDFIQKPPDPQKLIELVNGYLNTEN